MADHNLTPVFTALRIGLHAMTAGLLALVVVRVLTTSEASPIPSLFLCALFLAIYLFGMRLPQGAQPRSRLAAMGWLIALTVVWAALLILVPEAAYLVFPLFFLYLHLLPGPNGPAAVIVATAVAVLGLGWHSGFTLGGVVGPTIGAAVALLIGLGYRALAAEAVQREQLVTELIETRDRLAATEREQGMLAERARLAREIHDTVAQGLASIQMLLHAAERLDGDRPGSEYTRLARETAAANLADTRRFIRELAPAPLDDGLPAALRRVASAQLSQHDLVVDVEVPAQVELPMQLQTSLLRIVQGALANVVQHAHAQRAAVGLDVDTDTVRLTVADDGVGFDHSATMDVAGGTDSFGLRAISERVEQLNGTLRVRSTPGSGTILSVELPRSPS